MEGVLSHHPAEHQLRNSKPLQGVAVFSDGSLLAITWANVTPQLFPTARSKKQALWQVGQEVWGI